jgi:hypothetical protein
LSVVQPIISYPQENIKAHHQKIGDIKKQSRTDLTGYQLFGYPAYVAQQDYKKKVDAFALGCPGAYRLGDRYRPGESEAYQHQGFEQFGYKYFVHISQLCQGLLWL